MSISPAAVERGRKVVTPADFMQSAVTDRWIDAFLKDFLTAALRLDDPETVERVADALGKSGAGFRDEQARVAIAALLGD